MTEQCCCMAISELPDMQVMQNTLGDAWRLHMHCYHYRDNAQSPWLQYQGTAGIHLLWQPHYCNSVSLLSIQILIVRIQNSYWNASVMIKLKMMTSLNYERRLIEALIIKPNWIIKFPCHAEKRLLADISHSLETFSNAFIFYHQRQSLKKPLQATWCDFCSKLRLCQTYFFIKSCLSHTFPRAVQSVTQTERVHLSLPIYALLFSPRLSPSCNTGMVDSCLLIQCHSLFPLSVCFDVSIQQDQWVSQRASVSRPTTDIRTQTLHKVVCLFPACLGNLRWPW